MLKEKLLVFLNKFIIKKVKTKLDNITENIDNTSVNEEEKLKNQFLYDPISTPSHELMNGIDYDTIKQPEILNPDGKKTIIVVDDVVVTDILYRTDLKKMAQAYNVTPYEDFKIVKCIGDKAGFQAYKYVVLEGNTVDYGVLDITLGHQVRVLDGYYMELDGIDIAKFILEKCPDFKFLLCTAHTLNKSNSTITKYDNKVSKYLGGQLENYYLNKNSHRVDKFYNLIYGDKVKEEL